MRLIAEFVRSSGKITACTVKGHAPAAEEAEYSVLCAAVSSAMQLACNTLTECFGVPEDAVSVNAAEGAQNQISVRLHNPDSTQSGILQGLLIHFKLLAEDSGGAFTVRVRER